MPLYAGSAVAVGGAAAEDTKLGTASEAVYAAPELDAAPVGSNTAGDAVVAGLDTALPGLSAPGATHRPFDGASNGIAPTRSTVTRSAGPGSGYSSAVPAVLRHSPSAIWPGRFMSPTNMWG